ncbi:hypothetical protein ACTWPT_56335 [Nonomuraea sp. 3N208]|uniref:hypothetical protein n=1 Tax=Nonomuraea sp. 3N208 TaxID=3457421 RepID=UPI003FD62143
MLRRLLLTASLMASTFFVTGAVTAPAVNAATTCASSSQQAIAEDSAKKCEWRWWHGKRCYFCKSEFGHWYLVSCKKKRH